MATWKADLNRGTYIYKRVINTPWPCENFKKNLNEERYFCKSGIQANTPVTLSDVYLVKSPESLCYNDGSVFHLEPVRFIIYKGDFTCVSL